MDLNSKTVPGFFSTFVNHRYFSRTVIALILINTILIGMETYPALAEGYRAFFNWADRLLLFAFTVEIILRILSSRPLYHFFKSGWNWFDFIIVMSGYLFAGSHFITVLRILRVLRAVRVFSAIPSLRRLVTAFIMTIPSLGNIMLLMGLYLYLFGVIGTFLFAEALPEHFASLHLSLLSLFQIITLESWASGIMWPLLEKVPWAWIYFVVFILGGTFVIFNLFIGVIVNNVEKANQDEEVSKTDKELVSLRKEVGELKDLLIDLSKKR